MSLRTSLLVILGTCCMLPLAIECRSQGQMGYAAGPAPSPAPYPVDYPPAVPMFAPQYNAVSADQPRFSENDELQRLQAENHKLKYALDEAHQKIVECCSAQRGAYPQPSYRAPGMQPGLMQPAAISQSAGIPQLPGVPVSAEGASTSVQPKRGIGGMIKNAYQGYQDRKQQEAEYQKYLQYNYPELYATMKEREKDRQSYENQQFLNRNAIENWSKKNPRPVFYNGW